MRKLLKRLKDRIRAAGKKPSKPTAAALRPPEEAKNVYPLW